MVCSKNSSKREFYSNTNLPQETRKISNKQPNFTPKTTREKINKTQSKQKERNPNNQSRNKLDTKRTIEKINETKSWFFEKIKLINLQLIIIQFTHQERKRGLKLIKLEKKKETLQWTPQKYKELCVNIA